MPVVHFLNVKEGDCSIVQHGSGHVSVIDVCNARKEKDSQVSETFQSKVLESAGSGNLNQKAYPVNPIEYLKKFNIYSIFRFVLSHPDMDHMDGIKDLFEVLNPINFYDTDNNKELDFSEGSPYRKEDWDFYKSLRDEKPDTDPKRLTLFSGDSGSYRTMDWDGNKPGDAFYVLAPTPELVEESNDNASNDYNDCSYVILYHGAGGKVLFSGDAHDKTWEHIINTHSSAVQDVDLLIAPHHGRKSDRDYSFLDVLKPKMTFFGNAKSEYLAYSAWTYRKLPYITNNQANCMVVDAGDSHMPIFVTNETFARQQNPNTFFSTTFQGWFLSNIK